MFYALDAGIDGGGCSADIVCFVGGPIWRLDWAPASEFSQALYIAVRLCCMVSPEALATEHDRVHDTENLDHRWALIQGAWSTTSWDGRLQAQPWYRSGS